MKYQKPKILVLATAAAIRGGKGSDMSFDSQETRTNGAAYEADE